MAEHPSKVGFDGDDSRSRAAERPELKLRELTPVMDVVYGIVLTYGAALAMPLFQSWFVGHDSGAGVRACNIAFVLNYAIADFIEARVVTSLVPYEGKGRFSLDLLIAMAFLGALQAAAGASHPETFLLSMALAFAAAAAWAVILKIEERGRFRWKYGACVIATHIAASLLCVGSYFLLRTTNGLWFPFYLWCGYIVWLILVGILKNVAGVPDTGFDLLPISLIGLAVDRLMRSVRNSDDAK